MAWMGGALIVVLGVLLWLWFDTPEAELLPETYRFGVL